MWRFLHNSFGFGPGRTSRGGRKPADRHVRPRLEVLEDRTLAAAGLLPGPPAVPAVPGAAPAVATRAALVPSPLLVAQYVTAGGWRTLEWRWNSTANFRFWGPAGAQIRVLYGSQWFFFGSAFFEIESQRQTLDGGLNPKTLTVSRLSVIGAQVQIKVPRDTFVVYAIV
jgi:hypothetical protein